MNGMGVKGWSGCCWLQEQLANLGVHPVRRQAYAATRVQVTDHQPTTIRLCMVIIVGCVINNRQISIYILYGDLCRVLWVLVSQARYRGWSARRALRRAAGERLTASRQRERDEVRMTY